MTRAKMFAIFLAIALGGSWVIAALFAGVWSEVSPAQRAVSIIYQLPVLLAALIIQGPILRQPVLKPLGIQLKFNRFWIVGWLCPLVVLAVAVLTAWLLFGVEPVLDAATYIERKRALVPDVAAFDRELSTSQPGDPIYFVLQALPAGVTINLVLALATEIGWRGFLFREIQGGFWRRSFLIGLAEAAWIAPPAILGYQFSGQPWVGGGLIAVWCVVSSPVWVYLRVRADSVLAVAAARGTLLALIAVAADLTLGASPWVRPFYGMSGIVGMLALLGLFGLHDRFAAQRLMVPSAAPRVP